MILTTGNALWAVVFSIRCMMDTRVRENIKTMFGFIMSFAFNLEIMETTKENTLHYTFCPLFFSGQKARLMIFLCVLLQRATKIQMRLRILTRPFPACVNKV